MKQILKEYEYSNLLPLECLDDIHLQLLVDAGDLEVKVTGREGFRVKSKGCSGQLKIADNELLFIPQYGFQFIDMLLPKALNIHKRKINLSLGKEDPISAMDFLISGYLIGYFENELKREIRQDFVQCTVQNVFGSGSLQAHKSLLYLEHGVTAPYWTKNEFSREHALNAICAGIYQTAGKTLQVDLKTRSHLFSIADQFSSRKSDTTIENLEYSLSLIDRRTEPYRDLIEMAQVFLIRRSMGSGSTLSRSFLVKNWRIFEMAIRHSLRKELGNWFEVKERKKYCSSSNSKLTPDYVFRGSEHNTFIGDAKYVDNSSLELMINHMYQLNAYMNGYGVHTSVLFFPTNLTGSQKEHRLSWGSTIHVVRLPVCDSAGFDSQLTASITRLLGPARSNMHFLR